MITTEEKPEDRASDTRQTQPKYTESQLWWARISTSLEVRDDARAEFPLVSDVPEGSSDK